MEQFEHGWLAEQENLSTLFASPYDGLEIVSESEAIKIINETAKNRPIKRHPWGMAEYLHEQGECPYQRLTVWNQDASNCAGHGTSRAVEAFQLIQAWRGFKELTPFEVFVPWTYGVGKNEVGHYGDNGASMGSMLSLITKHGVLPADTPGLPKYQGTSQKWCQRYGKNAQNAPYSPFWGEAKKFIVKAAQIPKDGEVFFNACKAGFAVGFGTSQRIRMSGSGDLRKWTASGGWMHAMAAYGYNLDSVGIDNSHGDGFAWADRSVLKAVVDRARYFDAFVILDITPRPGKENWNPIGRD